MENRFKAVAYIDLGIENDYWTVWDAVRKIDCWDCWEKKIDAEKQS